MRMCIQEHRSWCPREEVECPCPGCDARLLRQGLEMHVRERHLCSQSAEELVVRVWHENAELTAAAESEQRHAAVPMTWVFNWRADWGARSVCLSEPHAFVEGKP